MYISAHAHILYINKYMHIYGCMNASKMHYAYSGNIINKKYISLSTGTLRRNMAVSHLRFSSEAVKSVDVTDGVHLNFVTEYFDYIYYIYIQTFSEYLWTTLNR